MSSFAATPTRSGTRRKSCFGKRLVTHQTGSRGRVVYRVYVEAATDIEREVYFAWCSTGSAERVALVASAEGGMEIEELVETKPEALIRISVEPAVGLQAFQARELALASAPRAAGHASGETFSGCLPRFPRPGRHHGGDQPAGVDRPTALLALDAKMAFDDNALFRRPSISELRDKSQEDPREVSASDRGLSYVGLDGNIGCIINGAGLAMATMDMIKHAGGEPGQFSGHRRRRLARACRQGV